MRDIRERDVRLVQVAGCAGYQVGIVSIVSHRSKFPELDGPAPGAVVVFWRKSSRSGLGHVGFYRGETAELVYVLGGNEDDMVQIEPLSKNQLRGYWWPTSAPKPAIGKIGVPPGTPKHQTKVT